MDEGKAQHAGEKHDENPVSSSPSRVNRLTQSYLGIDRIERVFGRLGIGELKQPGNPDGGFVHLGDIRQRRRGDYVF